MSLASKPIQCFFILTLAVVLGGQGARAQSFDSLDMALLRDVRPASQAKERVVVYGFGNNSTPNPLYHMLAGSMYGYQKWVSPVLGRHCAYSPSCSAYSKELLKEYGLLKGVFCTADRLMRCNRIALADKQSRWLLHEGHGHIDDPVSRYSLKP